MTERSPQFAQIEAFVQQEFEHLRGKLQPWAGFNYGPLRCTDFHGKSISYSNLKFSGTPRQIFWQFIDPFLKDSVTKSFEYAAALADRVGVDRSAPLADTLRLTEGRIGSLYRRIRQIDSHLTEGGGAPQIQGMIDQMVRFAQEVRLGWLSPAETTSSEVGGEAADDLSNNERYILQALRQHGKRMFGPDLWKKAIGITEPNKHLMANMKKRGLIDNKPGHGYGLPGWP